MNKLTVEDLKITLQMRLAEVDRRIQLGRQEQRNANGNGKSTRDSSSTYCVDWNALVPENRHVQLGTRKQQRRQQLCWPQFTGNILPNQAVANIDHAPVFLSVLAQQ